MTKRNLFVAFGFLFVLSILSCWHTVVFTFGLASSNDAYTHIFLILPLSAALIYQDLKQVRINVQLDPLLGMALLALALLIGGCSRWGFPAASQDVRVSLTMFALTTWWIGSVTLCFGRSTLRAFLFPLCFLFLMVPIPPAALDRIVEFLQYQSAFATRIMFRMVGVPAAQDGIFLSIPGLDIEVARECSSIRSSVILIVTTLFLAHLFLRSWWRKSLLVVAAIPISVAKNALRIFTIAMLTTRVDPAFIEGRLHHNGGIIFFAISVVVVIALLWALRRTEFRETVASDSRQ